MGGRWPGPWRRVRSDSPATSMVEVARLVVPEMLVEMEAEAIVSGAAAPKRKPKPRRARRR